MAGAAPTPVGRHPKTNLAVLGEGLGVVSKSMAGGLQRRTSRSGLAKPLPLVITGLILPGQSHVRRLGHTRGFQFHVEGDGGPGLPKGFLAA